MGPTVIHRTRVCLAEGRSLCGVCALRHWIEGLGRSFQGPLFKISTSRFVKTMRKDALELDVEGASALGSHAWRRGMAQDIIKAGGSLATLLRAGQWRSGAFRAYLQDNVLDEDAISKLVIEHSEDELD